MHSLKLLRALTDTYTAFVDPTVGNAERVAALRSAARAARQGGVEISDVNGRVILNGAPSPVLEFGEDVVVRAMRLHGVRRLVVHRNAGARDIAQMIGLLARTPAIDVPRDGAALAQELDELRLWSVRLVPGEASSDVPLPGEIEEALRRLAAATGAARDAAIQQLVGVVTEAVKRHPEQRARVVARSLAQALAADDTAIRDALRTHAATIPILVALADAVVSTDEATRRDALVVFREAGEMGPQGLVALLASAATIRQRRRCFDALIAIGGAEPALARALLDPHWYVVRNAAQLLGELRAESACGALERTLSHADARVRASAAAALEQIGTPAARAALQSVAADDSPEVRRIAARAFEGGVDLPAGAAGVQPVARLIAALDRETDPETFLEQIRALGAIGTPDTIQRLLRILSASAHPAQPLPARLAAVEALVRARGAAALPMLRELRQDRDPAMRAMARKLASTIAA